MTSAADWDKELAQDMPILHRRDRGEDVEMDITPMIDITFLLLIFFIVCSTPDQESGMELPRARYGRGVEEKNSVIIKLSAEGDETAPIYLADGLTEQQLPDDVETQKQMIQQAVEKGRNDQQKENVLIKADRNVAHRDVAKVIKAVSRVPGAKIHLAVLESE